MPAEQLGQLPAVDWPSLGPPDDLDDAGLHRYGLELGRRLFVPGLRELLAAVAEQDAGADRQPRLQIRIDPADHDLQRVCWELLIDPDTPEQPLFLGDRWRCSRYLRLGGLLPPAHALPARHELRALVAVASPRASFLPPLKVEREQERAMRAFAEFSVTLLGGPGQPPASATQIQRGLAEGAQILYLVCHGGVLDGVPRLWLDPDDEQVRYTPFPALDLAASIASRPPLLVILCSCHSSDATLNSPVHAIGPRLAQAGVGAVIAMHGEVEAAITARFPAELLCALAQRGGDLEGALAAARRTLRNISVQSGSPTPWWRPVLWSRLPYGLLYAADAPRANLAALAGARDFQGLLAATAGDAARGWDGPTLQLYRAVGLLAGCLPSLSDDARWRQVEAALLAAGEAAAPRATAATAWSLLLLAGIERYVLRDRALPGLSVAELRRRLCAFAPGDRDQELIDAFPATPEARAAFVRWSRCPP